MSGLFPQHGEILLYDNGTDKQFVSVVFQDETFWLTQSGMAELFDCSTDNISLHLKNIYADGGTEPRRQLPRKSRWFVRRAARAGPPQPWTITTWMPSLQWATGSTPKRPPASASGLPRR